MKTNSKIKKAILALALIATSAVTPAFASSLPPTTAPSNLVPYDKQLISRKPSTNDEVGIAFLKTAGIMPDFKKAVETSAAFKALSLAEQPNFLVLQQNKLNTAYLAFSPKKSDLIIRMKVNATFRRESDGTAIMRIKPPTDGQIYFPFFFANYPIALIVNGIENFQDVVLSKEEGDIVYSRLALNGTATLLLQLYPTAADATTPMALDNVSQYPLLADIGYIGLLNRDADQIWAWKNEKYNPSKIGAAGTIANLVPDTKR